MDLSTLTEAQQQQLQQLHQQFQQHQLQQQQQLQQQEQIQQQQQQPQPQQQQHHQQDLSSQVYDPSQTQVYDQANQAYDPSNQAYYPYNQYQQQPQQQAYYPYPDYANPYQQQHPQQQQHQPSQPDSAAVQPPGIAIPPESSQIVAAAAGYGQGQFQGQGQGQEQVQYQQNAYYPQAAGEQQNSSYPVPPGLNPAAAAAVAALSQLTQFAGKMDAAERAMAGLQERQWHAKSGGYGQMPMPMPMPGMPHGRAPMRPEVGRSPYRGGGRRGGGSFRDGGRGNFGQRQPRSNGSAPPFRGRGRMGRGGGRRFAPHAAASTSHTAPMPDQDSAESKAAPSAVEQGEAPQAQVTQPSVPAPGQAPLSALALGQVAPIWLPPQIAWCELCRVDCTSLEILEQHKNGKRHKKNLQRVEELQKVRRPVPEIQNEQKPGPTIQSDQKPLPEIQNEQKPVSGIQSEQTPLPESKSEVTVQPEHAQGVDENKPPTAENLSTEAVTAENKTEIEQQNDSVEQSAKVELSEAPGRRPRMDRFDSRRRGMKRKMRGDWGGGKRMRTSEGPRRPVEPPKPKEAVLLICDLCNVKCETQAVFDCHLAGKKHLSRLKRFQGHQAFFGPVGLQALYPPNPSAQSAVFIAQGHPQAYYGHQGSLPQVSAYGIPQAQEAAVTAATGSEPLVQRYESQGSHVMLDPGSQKAITVESEGQKLSAAVVAEGQQAVSVETQSENSISASEGKGVSPALDNLVVPPPGNVTTIAGNVLPAADGSVPVPEYGVTLSEHVVLPGLDIKMEEHGSKNEEPTA